MDNLKSTKDSKQLKIYKKYCRRFRNYSTTSEIRLCGKWIENLGFKYGDTINLVIDNNRIIIKNQAKIKIVL